jgi:hypothetical protein
MPLSNKAVVCPHCNRYSANDKICTSLGCGKRIAAPVQLFARARARKRPVSILKKHITKRRRHR